MSFNLHSVVSVDFIPCDGFGDGGRTATLRDGSGDCIAFGHGADDREAVLEALLDAGLSWNAAFDSHGDVLMRARLNHAHGLTPSE